jgi:hypothetical protein
VPDAAAVPIGVVQVITTPVGTSFDQLRAADEVQYKFDRCCKALEVMRGSLGETRGRQHMQPALQSSCSRQS